MNEWKKFKVGVAASSGFNEDCRRFDSVSHTSHVSAAINIIEAGEVRPSLVFDKSKLNEQRILVSWLSPNYWSTGFRYGNIRFDFSFNELIKNKKFYWVESIAYQVEACRILITDIDRNSQLDPYDPTSKNGPWWFDEANDQHYFNGKHCLEFMIEAPISLSYLKKLDFVDHHKNYCSVHRQNPTRCPEFGLNSSKGGAIFLTRAAVTGIDLSQLSTHFVIENGNPSFELELAFSEFAFKISRKVNFKGTLTEESESSIAVMRAIMSAFTFGLKEEAKLLCAMFQDEDNFNNVAAIVFADTVGYSKWHKLVRD
ncbi:hypothetical protein [Methylobacter tundripaludum]|uniref:hypothetical protein n=1 Tax=Methylobacter tundripaludum TaxID=173365 RepID=UPI0004DF2891|nr:hypothetical protein [Methylobacter tundripaludum]